MNDHALIDRWVVHMRSRGLAVRTIEVRVHHVRRLLRHAPTLNQVTVDLLEGILAGSDYAAETLKSMRGSWRSFYAWAVRVGALSSDPAKELAPVRVPVTIPHLAPDDDIAKAVAKAPPRERAMLLLGRLACLRLSEITRLHSDNWHGDWLQLVGKGGRERRVYVVPELRAALRAQLREVGGSGYFFPGRRGGHMHPQSVCKIIIATCGHNAHSLRHAGATAAYRATRDLRAVQMMLGHASMAVTQRYLHCDDEGLQAAAVGAGLRAA